GRHCREGGRGRRTADRPQAGPPARRPQAWPLRLRCPDCGAGVQALRLRCSSCVPSPTCKVTLAGGPLFRLRLGLRILSYCGFHGGDDDGIPARTRGGVGHERHEGRVDALVRLEGDPVHDVGLNDDSLQDLLIVVDTDMQAGGANHHREVARLCRELCGLPEVRVDLGHVHSYFVCLTRTLMSAPSMKPPNRAALPTEWPSVTPRYVPERNELYQLDGRVIQRVE